MPTKVVANSEWYLISASWVKKWQKHTYFDCIDNEGDISKEGRDAPGKIDCSDIAEPVTPNVLQEPQNSHDKKWQDVQVQLGKKDAYDFLIINKTLKEEWEWKYNCAKVGPIERRGIVTNEKNEGGFIETRMKTFKVLAYPNSHFNFKEPQILYMSRSLAMIDLKRKMQRTMGHIASNKGKNSNPNPLLAPLRIWACSRDLTYLQTLDQKYKDFTDTLIDARPLIDHTLSTKAEAEYMITEKVEFIKAIEGEDTLLVEIQKKVKDGKPTWTFRNKDTKINEEEKEESENIMPKSFELQDIFKADLRTILSKNHT